MATTTPSQQKLLRRTAAILGSGGQASVWSIRRPDGSRVALKVPLLEDEEGRPLPEEEQKANKAALLHEKKMLERCRCEYVVHLYDSVKTESHGEALLLEQLGPSLFSRLNPSEEPMPPFPLQERMTVAMDVLHALYHLHSVAGVALIDCKSCNVLLWGTPTRAKICDMGSACELRTVPTGLATPGYYDERISLKGLTGARLAAALVRMDLYAFTITFLEILSRSAPMFVTEDWEVHFLWKTTPLFGNDEALATNFLVERVLQRSDPFMKQELAAIKRHRPSWLRELCQLLARNCSPEVSRRTATTYKLNLEVRKLFMPLATVPNMPQPPRPAAALDGPGAGTPKKEFKVEFGAAGARRQGQEEEPRETEMTDVLVQRCPIHPSLAALSYWARSLDSAIREFALDHNKGASSKSICELLGSRFCGGRSTPESQVLTKAKFESLVMGLLKPTREDWLKEGGIRSQAEAFHQELTQEAKRRTGEESISVFDVFDVLGRLRGGGPSTRVSRRPVIAEEATSSSLAAASSGLVTESPTVPQTPIHKKGRFASKDDGQSPKPAAARRLDMASPGAASSTFSPLPRATAKVKASPKPKAASSPLRPSSAAAPRTAPAVQASSASGTSPGPKAPPAPTRPTTKRR